MDCTADDEKMKAGHISEESKGHVDGLGMSGKRSEQALIAAGPEWMADCFIDRGKSGGTCKSRVLLRLVRE